MPRFFASIREFTKEYLTFNYAERRGIMVLVILILLTESVKALLPVFIQQETCDLSGFEQEIKQFEAVLNAPDTLEKYKTRISNNETRNTKYEKEQLPKRSTYTKKAFAERPPLMIEINTADSAQLVRLPGIGPSYARRILKYRGMLGGFFSIEQLLEVFGMDSSRFEGIREHITLDSSRLHKINVNEADFKTLLHHPYLDFETVKLIANYREHSGPITCQDTLRMVIAYDPMYEAVKHYLDLSRPKIEERGTKNEQQDTTIANSIDSSTVISTGGRNL